MEKETKKVVVKVEPKDGQQSIEVNLREGKAQNILDVKAPLKIELKGVLGAPFEYLKKRLKGTNQFTESRCHLLVDRSKISILLVVNETDEYNKATVSGILEEHPKYKEFGINQGKKWDPNTLGQFLKMNRAFFPDKEKNMQLVTELKNFTGRVDSIVEKQKSEKGDFKDNYSGTVYSNLPESFSVQIPIFKGMGREIIDVEFYASIDGRTVTLELVSPGANQFLEEFRDKVIDEQIEQFAAFAPEIVIIEQ